MKSKLLYQACNLLCLVITLWLFYLEETDAFMEMLLQGSGQSRQCDKNAGLTIDFRRGQPILAVALCAAVGIWLKKNKALRKKLKLTFGHWSPTSNCGRTITSSSNPTWVRRQLTVASHCSTGFGVTAASGRELGVTVPPLVDNWAGMKNDTDRVRRCINKRSCGEGVFKIGL